MLRTEVIEGRSGRLLTVVHAPDGPPPVRSIVVIPPFAEEMNKARRMVTLFAEAAAKRGMETVVPDLTGTGDSDGEFEDARWNLWCDDVERVVSAAKHRAKGTPALLAIRSGALLASAVLERNSQACRDLLLWSPVTEGERFMKQFLRLRMAASLTQTTRETVADLESALRAGSQLEVGGYALASQLWAAINTCRFALPPPSEGGQVFWFDVLGAAPYELAPASQRSVAALSSAGWQVHARALAGAAFWATAEITEVPKLIAASVEALAPQP